MANASGTTVSAQEFNREPSKVKAKAANGPVFITDHGRRSHVILSIEEYERIKPAQRGLGSSLRQGWLDLVEARLGREAAGSMDDDFDLDPGDHWAGIDESGDVPDLSGN